VEHLLVVVVLVRIYFYLYVIPVNCVCVGYKKMPQEWEARLRNYDSLAAINEARSYLFQLYTDSFMFEMLFEVKSRKKLV